MKKIIVMLSIVFSINALSVKVFSSTYEQATQQLDTKNYHAAYKSFESLSQLGNKDAQFNIGVMHLKGEGREVSHPNAYAWFKLAASEGDAGYNTTFKNITKKISKKDLEKGGAIFADITQVYGDEIVAAKTVSDVKSIEKIRTKQLPVRRAFPEFSKNPQKAKSTPLATAEMRFMIGKDGRTKYQQVNAKTSEAYADTSIEALKQFLYHPVVVNGSPAKAYEIRNQFSYQLGKASYNKKKLYETLKASELKAEKQTSNDRIKHAYLHSLYRQYLPKNKKRDLKSNFYWYHKAAKDGNAVAQYELGTVFLVSKKAKTDQGLFWLERSAQSSHPKAQMILGLELISGQRIEANQEQGLAWLEKAAQNYVPAKIEYALALATIQDETLKNIKSAVAAIEQIDVKTVTDLVSLYEAQAVIYYLSGDQKAYKSSNKKLLKQAKKYDFPRKIISENVINIATGQPIKPLWLSVKTARLN